MKPKHIAAMLIAAMMAGEAAAADVYWFLAASMSKPGREVVDVYNRTTASSKVLLIIGGSGQLLSKIELTRIGGLYTPASTRFLKKAAAKQMVRHQHPLLRQEPVFGLSKTGADKIKSFDDLQSPGIRVAVGNPKTMALGAKYIKIEEKMGPEISKPIRRNAIVSGLNILQIVNYLKTGTVDAGTIFEATAHSHRLDYVKIPAQFNIPSTAHLIRLTFPVDSEEEVTRFEVFILKQHAIFERHGFKLLS